MVMKVSWNVSYFLALMVAVLRCIVHVSIILVDKLNPFILNSLQNPPRIYAPLCILPNCIQANFDMIYLLTAIGLSLGGSTHLHTNNTQSNTNNNRTTQITTNVEECGPCPVFTSFTLAFALQLRKKHSTLILCSLKFVGVKAKLSLPILRRHMCSGGIAQLILILHTSVVSFTPRPFCPRGGKLINWSFRGP
jgi:hypothetical protein